MTPFLNAQWIYSLARKFICLSVLCHLDYDFSKCLWHLDKIVFIYQTIKFCLASAISNSTPKLLSTQSCLCFSTEMQCCLHTCAVLVLFSVLTLFLDAGTDLHSALDSCRHSTGDQALLWLVNVCHWHIMHEAGQTLCTWGSVSHCCPL